MTATLSTRRNLHALVTGCALVIAACSPAGQPAGDEPAPDEFPAVEDATFTGLAGFPDPVTLTDGKWEGEPYVEGGSSVPAVYLSEHLVARGDLDGDGSDEAAAVLVTTTGGSGSFFYLVLLRESGGKLEHFATRLLGDRVRVRSLDIRDGGVDMVSIEAGENDPVCCPTRRVARRFAVDGSTIDIERESRSGPIERLYGFVAPEEDRLTFRTCAGDRAGPAVDVMPKVSLGDLYTEFATAPSEPVFMDVEGRWFEGLEEASPTAIEITAVHRVEREGFGCRLDVDGLLFRAFGNEPGWRLDVRPDGATLSSQTLEETVEFEGSGRLSNQQFEFENDRYRMGIAYLEIPCRDTMSGTYFSHQAEVRIGDRRYLGCAVPGR